MPEPGGMTSRSRVVSGVKHQVAHEHSRGMQDGAKKQYRVLRNWYPLYEKMVQLDVPAMVHVSASCNLNFHATGAHYINSDITAFMQFLTADLFADFPTLRFIILHGGAALPYHWGRYRGLAQDLKRPRLTDHRLKNVFFDTCVYHQPGIELLFKVIPADNIISGSEMMGVVRGIDPETGQYFDNTER
jgi:4-oxalmesaconate hydratase